MPASRLSSSSERSEAGKHSEDKAAVYGNEGDKDVR